ncbi:hypothetical protein BO71DRAFT_100318 [Aspergillus ellipticus CBS 707.79]|uniref:ribonuclease H n=1 Tax=Aspergillus ellipticus CBS 707.79 TaxID=1448320 RepID=A0A319EFE6_9EURO|nr:hypothetical protein BO71DRAFT_100318 [Aspergillus ellipticus CBS 707.79]
MREKQTSIRKTYPPQITRRIWTCLTAPKLGPGCSVSSCRPRFPTPRFGISSVISRDRSSYSIRTARLQAVLRRCSVLKTLFAPRPIIAMADTTPSPTTKRSPRSASPSRAGVKRKRGSTAKYYGVKAGYQPGVYYSWKDCLTQVTGYKGAVFQAFPSYEEAKAFMSGTSAPPARGGTPLDAEPTRFYGIQRGRKPGVYTDWAKAQEQIKGFPKPRYKKFATREEAAEFAKGGQGAAATFASQTLPGAPGLMSADGQGAAVEPGNGPLPTGAEDGFDPNVLLDPKTGKVVFKTEDQKTATKLKSVGPPGMLRIYTDGSALKNGRALASAGVGVYFGPGDSRFVSLVVHLCRPSSSLLATILEASACDLPLC